MKVAFVGCRAYAVISMASKRDVLFATQYYGTYDCSKCVHVFFKHLLVLRGNPVWRGFFWFLNTSDYGNAGFTASSANW